MLIFLVGYMGSGKTTFGSQLAQAMKLDWVDLDSVIEQQTGRPIAEIITRDGEDSFRALEHEALSKLVNARNTVISTGGGTPCFHSNMDVMKAAGMVVYLKYSAAHLAARLENDTENRPLLQGLSGQELENHISCHLLQRELFYQQAHFTVDGMSATTAGVKALLLAQSK
jgi:shikimate kinase